MNSKLWTRLRSRPKVLNLADIAEVLDRFLPQSWVYRIALSGNLAPFAKDASERGGRATAL